MRRDVWRLVPLLALCLAILGPVALFLTDVGCAQLEVGRRQREGEGLRELSERIRQRPADPTAMEELAAYESHRDGWDRAVMFSAMRGVGAAVRADPAAGPVFQRVLLPVIRRGLDDPDAVVRREAANAACAFGRLMAPAVPELMRAMTRDPHEDTALFASEATGQIGPEARDAIPAVESVSRAWVREDAPVVALRRLRGEEPVPE